MNKLQEIFDAGKPNIISERKLPDDLTMTVEVPWIQADKKNQNGRKYPLALLKREVARIQSAVSRGAMIGTGDHPIGGLENIATSSHILQKVWLDKKGKGWAEMKIVPTERGNSVMTLISQDAQLGVSARGFGTVDEKTGEVQSDYKLVGIDIVINPSYKEGVFNKSNIFESLNLEDENKEDKMMGLSEKYVDAMVESIYGMQVDEGSFEGSLEDFQKQKGNLVRAEILVAHDHFESTEEALRHLGADEEAKRISNAPIPFVQRKVTPADVYYEAQMMGIDPKVYADKLNATLEEKEVEPDFTAEEVSSILNEAQASGIDITNPEERKRILNLAREQKKKPKVLTEEKAFIQFAVREGLNERTAKKLWKRKQEEKKRGDKIAFLMKENIVSGLGNESRPDVRKRSKKIIEGE